MSTTKKSLGERWRGWRTRRLERKLSKLAPAAPTQMVEPEPDISRMPSFRQLRRVSEGAFSLRLDDLGQYFATLGDDQYLFPKIVFSDTNLDRLLNASAWAWASVHGNSKAMSQLTCIVQEQVAGKWQRAPAEHPLWKFLADPLGTDRTLPWWSWSHLYYVEAMHYYSNGNGWLLPVDSALGLSVIPILSPASVTVETEDEGVYGEPRRYTWRNKANRFQWSPDRIVNIMAPSPSSLWRGASPLKAALSSVEIDHVATKRQQYNLRNQVAPGLTIAVDRPLGPTPEQRQVAKQELLDDYQDVADHGLPWIIGSGAKVTKGFSPEELQVFDTKHASREEIGAVIGTQPSVLGLLDRATYSNSKVATILWWNSSLLPVITQIYGCLNAQLVQRRWPDSRLWYSLAGTDVGLQLMSAKLEVGVQLAQLGLSTADIGEILEIDLPDRKYLKVPGNSWITAGRIEPERLEEVINALEQMADREG